jgi:hypothetical protein
MRYSTAILTSLTAFSLSLALPTDFYGAARRDVHAGEASEALYSRGLYKLGLLSEHERTPLLAEDRAKAAKIKAEEEEASGHPPDHEKTPLLTEDQTGAVKKNNPSKKQIKAQEAEKKLHKSFRKLGILI